MMESRPKVPMKAPTKSPLRKLLLATALAGLTAAGLGGAARAEDGVFSSVLKNLGLGSNDPIEYRERPPLVVPQTRDLPPPQRARTARDPNWPTDPKAGARGARSDQLDDLDRLAVPERPAPPDPAATASVPANKPAERGFFDRVFSKTDESKGAVPTNLPSRKTLTQPPANYEELARPGATDAPAVPGQAGASGGL